MTPPPPAPRPPEKGYSLLPFRFGPLRENAYLLTNFAGDYLVIEHDDLHRFVRHDLSPHTPLYDDLKARHFLMDSRSAVAVDLLAARYRTRLEGLSRLTGLFMVVTTLRCDHRCRYCQATSRSAEAMGCDMDETTARQTVEFIFQSPSPAIKIEFQGGEPLLHFERLQQIVLEAKARNAPNPRPLAFVVATNLSPLTDAMLDFCRREGVFFSTSLDGPPALHNANRPCAQAGADSHAQVVAGIQRVCAAMGPEAVSALMTTTKAALRSPREIVDEYVRLGFSSIFLRPLNPYGLAARHAEETYGVEEWLAFYREALAYILDLNLQGIPIREEYAALLLRRILTPYATGFVDLQSPAGLGIAGMVVHYDGSVYPSDEARMLAEMGDATFRLGHVSESTYDQIITSDKLVEILSQTMTEGMPACAECPFQPYCGSDPVRHYREQGEVVGHKALSGFCRKHQGLFRHLIGLLEGDARIASVLRRWAR